jgi:hypothetical protein
MTKNQQRKKTGKGGPVEKEVVKELTSLELELRDAITKDK